ncbi:hypothetical protein [Pseudonocardia humida]|uniref:Uncharacterized protein n=1 Tax=Pseudonocardia humida TaxID=2800819 RepID=A0ABT1A5P5_9PSEU|nr:hypothetical protein [Pseudonocardia humida]MCO1658345.1 hypothetical protein [Pseudonocardia humida]
MIVVCSASAGSGSSTSIVGVTGRWPVLLVEMVSPHVAARPGAVAAMPGAIAVPAE